MRRRFLKYPVHKTQSKQYVKTVLIVLCNNRCFKLKLKSSEEYL